MYHFRRPQAMFNKGLLKAKEAKKRLVKLQHK
jgi:hypothetical protein